MIHTKDQTRAAYGALMDRWAKKLGDCNGDGEDGETLRRLVDELHRVADDGNVAVSSRSGEPGRHGKVVVSGHTVWGRYEHGRTDPDTKACSRHEYVMKSDDGREWVFPLYEDRATIRRRCARMARELARPYEAPAAKPATLALVRAAS